MDTPKEESLRQMSYSELKRCAKSCGIKKNKRKTGSLIAAILEKTRSDEDSFVTMEQNIINSCKKNKLEKFDEDLKVVSETPRRETYTIDSPLDSIPLNNELISSSASPVLKTPVTQETSMNVTLSRGSDRKIKKRKVSFVTPIRRSARLSTLTPHYASVKGRPKTPIPSSRKRESLSSKKNFSGSLYISDTARKSDGGEKKRPSTPMPQSKPKRMKLDSAGLLETPIASPCSTPKSISTVQQKITFTPVSDVKKAVTQASLSITKMKKNATPKSGVKQVITPAPFSSTKVKRTGTPKFGVKQVITPAPFSSTKVIRTGTPKSSIKQAIKPVSLSITKVKRTATPVSSIKSSLSSNKKVHPTRTPKSGMKNTTPSVQSNPKLKRVITPNFNKLHQKQFDKMESIDEYQKRRALNSAKKIKEQLKFHEPTKTDLSKKMLQKKSSKIPQKFGGIPFIPSVTSIKNIKTNFGTSSLSLNTTSGERLPAVKFGQKNKKNLSKKPAVEASEKSIKSVSRENTPLRRNKFDLKASLSKKLPYKPHAGPLKPLAEMNLNTPIQLNTCPAQKRITIKNQVVQSKRIESRGILRGVRRNKRFELQMKNRKPVSA